MTGASDPQLAGSISISARPAGVHAGDPRRRALFSAARLAGPRAGCPVGRSNAARRACKFARTLLAALLVTFPARLFAWFFTRLPTRLRRRRPAVALDRDRAALAILQ